MLAPSESDPGEAPRKTLPADVKLLRHTPSMVSDERGEPINDGATWMEVTLREGRTRQIHRMAEAVGLFVMRLARMSFAGITAEGLRPGEKRALTDDEVTLLRREFLRPAEGAALLKGHDGDYPEDPNQDADVDTKAPVRKRAVKRPGGLAGRAVGESVSRARETAAGATRNAKGPAAATRSAKAPAGRDAKAPAGRDAKAPAGRAAPKADGSSRDNRGGGGGRSGGRGGHR